MPYRTIPRHSSNSVGSIFFFMSLPASGNSFAVRRLTPSARHRRRLIDPPGEPEHIRESRQRTDKKQQDHPERSTELPIQKHSRKRTQKNRNQHINTELRYHRKCLINISIIFHCSSLLQISCHTVSAYFLYGMI